MAIKTKITIPLEQEDVEKTMKAIRAELNELHADMNSLHALVEFIMKSCRHPRKKDAQCLDCGYSWSSYDR